MSPDGVVVVLKRSLFRLRSFVALTSSSLLLGAVINEWREWIRERKSVCERVKMIEREREREREREIGKETDV